MVFWDNSAMVRRERSAASAARMPGPPELVTTARFGPPGLGLAGKCLGQVEERGHVVHPDDSGLVEGRGVGLVGPGDGPGVRRGGLGPRRRGAGLDHDHRLVLAGAARGLEKRLAVLHVLDVAEDDARIPVVIEIVEHVRLVEHRLVAQGHELGKADVRAQRPVEDGHAQCAALGEKGDGAGIGLARGKGGVDPARSVHHAQAVGTQERDAVLLAQLDDPLLQVVPLLAHLLEPGGDDDGGLGVDRAQPLDGGDDEPGRHRDHGQVQAARQVRDVRGHGQPLDLPALGVHRDDPALEPGPEHVDDHGVPHFAGGCGRADDGHGLGIEKGVQIVDGNQAVRSWCNRC